MHWVGFQDCEEGHYFSKKVILIYAILLSLKSTHRYQFYDMHIIAMVILHVMEALWRVQYREVEMYGRYY